MSKHVSRLLTSTTPFRNFLSHQQCPSALLQWAQTRLNHSKSQPELPRPNANAPIKSSIWRKIGWWTLAGLGTLGYAWYVKNEKDMDNLKYRQIQLRKTAMGGKWQLIDGDGKVHHSDEFLGKWCLIYFGFTHCPDICPDEMEKLAGVINDLDQKKIEMQPVFITVDPERDTKEVVGKYVKEFSTRILGLTGSVEEVAQAALAYRVYFRSGPKDEEDDYIVDHTIITYLVDPNGEFVDYYGRGKTREEVVTSVMSNKRKWEALNKKGWMTTMAKEWDSVRQAGWFENK